MDRGRRPAVAGRAARDWPSALSSRSAMVEASPRLPKPGRQSKSSGRAVVTTISGPSAFVARCSMMSTNWSPAQCRSSMRKTAGRVETVAVTNRAHAPFRSAAAACGPEDGERVVAVGEAGGSGQTLRWWTAASSFDRASGASRSPRRTRSRASTWSGGSPRLMLQAWRRMSPSALPGRALPTLRHRPRQTWKSGRRSRTASTASATRRDFPTPTLPTTLTRRGRRLPTTSSASPTKCSAQQTGRPSGRWATGGSARTAPPSAPPAPRSRYRRGAPAGRRGRSGTVRGLRASSGR